MARIIRIRSIPGAFGLTLHPSLVLVTRDAKADLIAHELHHARQMESDGWLRFLVRYALSRKCRLAYEASAYAVSVKNGAYIEDCARYLAGGYFLGITAAEARDAIEQHLQP